MTEGPGHGPDHIMRGLALPRRIGSVVAGLGGLAGASLVGMLWATEPGELPVRTQIAFAALILVGVAWAVHATSALLRRPLFAIDRLVGAWLAVIFSLLMAVGLVVIALTRDSTVGLAAVAGLGLPLIVVASLLLIRARAYRRKLLARQRDLETKTDTPEESP